MDPRGADRENETGESALQPVLDPAELRAALDDADLRVLLMVLHHMTGERRWLEDPYRPRRDVRLIADESAGFDPVRQAEIRSAAFDLLVDGAPVPVIADLDVESLIEMMSCCLGEEVPPEYGPLMLEDMGFGTSGPAWSTSELPPALCDERRDDNRLVIVGAGVNGLGLGMQCQRLGIPFTILERNSDVGGTWFENHYPGAGVDTPNLFYSWSHHPNPSWSRYFAQRDELLAYLQDAADEFDLRRHIRFDTSMQSARWNAEDATWDLVIDGPDGPESMSARFLISAIGHISEPNDTRFPGMDEFEGPLFHSARWPEDLDVAGRRVAVIGTGATAMQLCPTIADRVEHLTIYQRTPQWARPTPEYHRVVSPGAQWLFEHVPFYARWFRFTLFWRYGDGLLRFLRRDPDWDHPERAMNRTNDRHRQQMTEHIHDELHDRPDLVEQCVPDYPPYGKRILLDNGWFSMLKRDDVELVTEPVVQVDAGGVIAGDHNPTHRTHDVVVLATGFSIARLTARLDIVGASGQSLADAWADDNPTAYLGITVPDFPNLFISYGPNTNLGHGGSAFFAAECQTNYILGTIVEILERGLVAAEIGQPAHDQWVADVDAEHAELIWTHPKAANWYRNKHGRVVSTSPFRLVDYWEMTHQPDLDRYHTR